MAQPGFFERVGAIVDLWENPCGASWEVYARSAVEPAGELVIGLLTFGLDDIVRGYARPKSAFRAAPRSRFAARLRRRVRRLPGGRILAGGIPEIGEAIGRRLPFADVFRSRTVSEGVNFFWRIDGVLQRGLFWWMVADLTSDFLYDWNSQIMETAKCDRMAVAWGYHEIQADVPHALLVCSPFGAPMVVVDHYPPPGQPSIVAGKGSLAWGHVEMAGFQGPLHTSNWGCGLLFKHQDGTEKLIDCHNLEVPAGSTVALSREGFSHNVASVYGLFQGGGIGCVWTKAKFSATIYP